MNKIVAQDIENINKQFDMSVFEGKSVLVTGATGYIGSFCVRSLLASKYNIKVIALARNEDKAKQMYDTNQNLKILVQDINAPVTTDEKIDYIIHTAGVTASKDFVEKPVETIWTSVNGTRNILELAKEKKCLGVVYISSLEIYGIPQREDVTEKDYGYIDILSPRGSHPESRRMAENLCISYGTEYNVPVKIARLTQTFGAGISKNDSRVYAQFAKSVIDKKDIILHTEGFTKRCYCYITDAITGIFTVLTKGENNMAYNVANKNTYTTIYGMAQSLVNENTNVVYDIDNKDRGYNPEVKISMDTRHLELLGWRAKVSLKEMFERLINSMENS